MPLGQYTCGIQWHIGLDGVSAHPKRRGYFVNRTPAKTCNCKFQPNRQSHELSPKSWTVLRQRFCRLPNYFYSCHCYSYCHHTDQWAWSFGWACAVKCRGASPSRRCAVEKLPRPRCRHLSYTMTGVLRPVQRLYPATSARCSHTASSWFASHDDDYRRLHSALLRITTVNKQIATRNIYTHYSNQPTPSANRETSSSLRATSVADWGGNIVKLLARTTDGRI